MKSGDASNSETVAFPEDKDILGGKSKACANHVGSRRYREYLGTYRDRYAAATTKYEKMCITREIYKKLKAKQCRFLKFNKSSGVWEEIAPAAARDKIGHALRFNASSGFSVPAVDCPSNANANDPRQQPNAVESASLELEGGASSLSPPAVAQLPVDIQQDPPLRASWPAGKATSMRSATDWSFVPASDRGQRPNAAQSASEGIGVDAREQGHRLKEPPQEDSKSTSRDRLLQTLQETQMPRLEQGLSQSTVIQSHPPATGGAGTASALLQPIAAAPTVAHSGAAPVVIPPRGIPLQGQQGSALLLLPTNSMSANSRVYTVVGSIQLAVAGSRPPPAPPPAPPITTVVSRPPAEVSHRSPAINTSDDGNGNVSGEMDSMLQEPLIDFEQHQDDSDPFFDFDPNLGPTFGGKKEPNG